MAYLALRIRFIDEFSQNDPPPNKVLDLISCLELTENENELIQNLIKRRTQNKNEIFLVFRSDLMKGGDQVWNQVFILLKYRFIK